MIGIAMVLGFCLALVFSIGCRHSPSFTVAVSIVPMTVALVILLINGNAGMGIAIAGTFTLVRFRSAPGTGLEIAGLFTAMTVGLTLGMGYAYVAVAFFLATAVFVLLLTLSPLGSVSPTRRYLWITIPENMDYNGLFDDIFAAYRIRAKLERVKSGSMGTFFELTYEFKMRGGTIDAEFINSLRARNCNLTVIVGSLEQHERI